MPEDNYFQDLIRRVRERDPDAEEELVRRYGDHIARVARIRLNRSLSGKVGSSDICQSVLFSFFLQLAMGKYPNLETPEDFLRLLTVMIRNKVIDKSRKHKYEEDMADLEPDGRRIDVPAPDPGSAFGADEELAKALRLLSPDERRLLELRETGRQWVDIAAEVGGKPDALRKKLDRALERVREQLGSS